MSAGGDKFLYVTALFTYFKGFFAVGFLPKKFDAGAGASRTVSAPTFNCAGKFSAFWFWHIKISQQ